MRSALVLGSIVVWFFWSPGAVQAQDLVINELMSRNPGVVADEDGAFPDWIELYNGGATAIDLTGYGLSDDADEPRKWTFAGGSIPSGGHLLVFASGKDRPDTGHTNFRLDADGEVVVLTTPTGDALDVWTFNPLPTGVSTGRSPDGGAERVLFTDPTPGASNAAQTFAGQADPPRFGTAGGWYAGGVAVDLQVEPSDAVVHYTTDGSVPTTEAARYDALISVEATTVLRARAFRAGYLPSETVSRTFVVAESRPPLPIVALTTDPPHLWDWEEGIYVLGPDAAEERPFYGANFWKDWEIPMHVEFYEPADGSFAQEMGAQIFGGWSREAEQKSFALFARDRYGRETLAYPLFPGHEIDHFQSVILRNTGNDRAKARLRDPLMHRLVAHLDLETQAYRPVEVWLNGAYWGHYNLREKINEDYLAAHHGIDPDRVDILEVANARLDESGVDHEARVVEGSAAHYRDLLAYLQANGAADPADYAEVRRRMEVDNFIDYQIVQIYYADTDWPGNNVKFWRPQTPGGRWRWIFFDADVGFYGVTIAHPDHPTLAFATAENGPGWPNPPWSTFLLRTLLENDTFRTAFINRFADHLNHTFTAERMTTTLDTLAAELRPVLDRHFARWEGEPERWQAEVDLMYAFARGRTEAMWSQVGDYFELAAPRPVRLIVDDATRGVLRINRLPVPAADWTGRYFPGVPVQVRARPAFGYRFAGWTGATADGTPIEETAPVLTIDPADEPTLTAHFEPAPWSTPPVVINEIHYAEALDVDTGDWIELVNLAADPIDLSGWIVTDGEAGHVYELPDDTWISGGDPEQAVLGGFVVVARDPAQFRTVHADESIVLVGGWSFGLDAAGEHLGLLSPDGQVVDSLTYGTTAPWPDAMGGYTIHLLSPHDDNALPSSWSRSPIAGGTPGAPNTTSVASEDGPRLPETAELDAGYPNPFAATTMLGYHLPAPARVELAIYDVVGRRVALLVDEDVPAGRHRAVWRPAGVSPGVYLARLRVDGAERGVRRLVRVR